MPVASRASLRFLLLRYARRTNNKTCGQSQKENTIRQDGVSFLEQHFCYAKVVACGRVIEREWGNPSKVPPSHSPFLAVGGSADNKTCGQSQKETPSVRMVFFLEQHFCCAKSVACGRVIERERGIAAHLRRSS